MTDWYEKTFGKQYLEIYGQRNEQEAEKAYPLLEKIIEGAGYGDRAGTRILDLACGAGRYSILLASKGYPVTGVDLSRPLLDEALKKWNGLEKKSKSGTLELVHSDMRELPFKSGFNLVINMFTSFGYFESDAENMKVIQTIARLLVSGGRFVIDYLNRDAVIANLEKESESRVGDYRIKQRRWLTKGNLRVEKEVEVINVIGDIILNYTESVRMYDLSRMKTMIEKSNLELTDIFGDYDGTEFSASSPRLILGGRKP